MPSPVQVVKSGPGPAQLIADLRRIKKSEVLVGIPAEKTQRKKETVNNASLLFVFSNGSPLRHIPPRPVLEPAIEQNKDLVTPHLAEAARLITEHRPDAAQRELQRAGTIAANAAKRRFTEPNDWAPNAPSTIKHKNKKHKGEARPGIDSGQMRRALTYVVRVNP
jgi:hypothetical protein